MAKQTEKNEVKAEETKATFVIESGVELPTKASGKTSLIHLMHLKKDNHSK